MKSWLSNFKKFGIRDASSFNLSCFRLVFNLAVAFTYLTNFNRTPTIRNPEVIGASWSQFFLYELFGFPVYQILALSLVACLVFSALGFIRAAFRVPAFLLFLLFEGPISFSVQPYTTGVIFYGLLLLAISPSAGTYNFFELLAGPRADKENRNDFTMLALMSIAPLVFFNAFISKLLNGGFGWMNGETLQAFLFERYLIHRGELTWMVVNSPVICLLLSVLTMIAEASLWVVIFNKPSRKYLIPIVIAFHVGVYVLMRIDFLRLYSLIYLSYIDYEYFYTIALRFIKATPGNRTVQFGS